MLPATRRRLGAVTASAALTLGMTAILPASPSEATATPRAGSPLTAPVVAAQVDAPIPVLDWSRCESGARALCATAEVPLDYDDPTGPTILLDLLKVPALDSGNKLGTLFVNPGGPGGSATEFAFFGADLLGDTVAMRYDVVGIDPRGVGEHSQMVCTAADDPPNQTVGFPITEQQSKQVWRAGRWIRNACVSAPEQIVQHMSTADTARDMDLIRQAVGEEELDYYGISYGTFLGATYAAMFPDRVGRFVVDGVLDPVNWSTGDAGNADLPFTTRIASARGAYEALTSGLTECDRVGKRSCAFAGDAESKWRWLVRKAKAGKLRAYGGNVSYPDLVGGTLGMLYDNISYDWLGSALADLYRRAHKHTAKAGGVSAAEWHRIATRVTRAPYALAGAGFEINDAFHGVSCADTSNPTTRQAWWDAGRQQDRDYPWFGSLWTWESAACAKWPAAAQEDSFRGPYDVTTANPILVVGNSHDPATPVQGARRFTTLFEGSRFLLMDGWGHGAIGNTCVTAAFDDYYATGALPREGSVCEKDYPLFGGFFKAHGLPSWRPQAG